MANSAEIQSTGQVVVSSITEQAIEITSPAAPRTVEVTTTGPQGSSAAPAVLEDIANVSASSKVNNSILYYDSSAGKWVGNDINTLTTITDGGNF